VTSSLDGRQPGPETTTFVGTRTAPPAPVSFIEYEGAKPDQDELTLRLEGPGTMETCGPVVVAEAQGSLSCRWNPLAKSGAYAVRLYANGVQVHRTSFSVTFNTYGGSWPSLAHAVQAELRALGCDPGPIDGLWGPRSQAALSRFVDASGEPIRTADLSDALPAVLRRWRGSNICGN
jgi:hypothetical protein